MDVTSNVRVERATDAQLVLVFRVCPRECSSQCKLETLKEDFRVAPGAGSWFRWRDHYIYIGEPDGYHIHVFATFAPEEGTIGEGTIGVKFVEPDVLSLEVPGLNRQAVKYDLPLAGMKECILMIVEHLGIYEWPKLLIGGIECSNGTKVQIPNGHRIGVSGLRASAVSDVLADENQLKTMLDEYCGSIEKYR
jgi:hypothetical protein